MSAAPGELFHVLFLCTGNSARSILAEATLNHLAAAEGRVRAWSAGSFPKGQPNSLALQLLTVEGIDTTRLRSKNWDEFSAPGAPPIRLVITVCDQAAGEQCPYYPGMLLKAHWGLPDPHSPEEFRAVYTVLRRRLQRLLKLPLKTLDRTALMKYLEQIGRD
jgi:arsenate reductase